jgi:hypothetical protein
MTPLFFFFFFLSPLSRRGRGGSWERGGGEGLFAID